MYQYYEVKFGKGNARYQSNMTSIINIFFIITTIITTIIQSFCLSSPFQTYHAQLSAFFNIIEPFSISWTALIISFIISHLRI